MDPHARLWTVPQIQPRWSMRWYWWFWMMFLDDPATVELPRQLMLLWTHREAATRFNDILVHPDGGITSTTFKDTFPGAAAAWYFDGTSMDHDLALEQGTVALEREADDPAIGRLSIEAQAGNEYTFHGGPTSWRLRLCNHMRDVDLGIHLEDPTSFTQPSYRINRTLGLFTFSALQLNRCRVEGLIDDEEVSGTAYFQRIGINNPLPPWFWGVVHFADGSMLKYFIPHLSTASLRRGPADRMPWHERWCLPFSRQAELYHAPTDTLYTFPRGHVERGVGTDGLPVWQLEAREGGMHLSATLETYARACWRFRSPGYRPVLGDMYYNEYPTRATALALTGPDSRLTLDELGPGVGNTEHTWGGLV